MQKFNYNLDYRNIFFQPNDYRYRIGEKEQGVFLVRPYSDDIGKFWKFSTEKVAEESSENIYNLYLSYKEIVHLVLYYRVVSNRPPPLKLTAFC